MVSLAKRIKSKLRADELERAWAMLNADADEDANRPSLDDPRMQYRLVAMLGASDAYATRHAPRLAEIFDRCRIREAAADLI